MTAGPGGRARACRGASSGLFALPVHWDTLASQALHPAVPPDEGLATWLFFAISLIGSAVVPYQVVFFSSGGVEEGWRRRDLGEMRLNVLVGFPLGMVLSLAIMACAVPVLQPRQVGVQRLEQVGLPVVLALGRVGLLVMLLGFFAATFAAAAECALSLGYSASQYFGWTWGKFRRPTQAPRFHVVMLAGIIAATALILTTIDPVQLTIVSVVLGAAAIPLTYFPILVVANDRSAMGRYVNKPWVNALGVVFLVVMVVVSLVSVPLLFLTADTEPARIPVEAVAGAQPSGLRLRVHRDATGTRALAIWTREKIVRRIPGSGHRGRAGR